MTTKDLQKRLGIGYTAACRLMRSPGFPSIQVGKKYVVDDQAYERWYRLNQGRQVIPEPTAKRTRRSTTKVYRTDWAQQIKEFKAELRKGVNFS